MKMIEFFIRRKMSLTLPGDSNMTRRDIGRAIMRRSTNETGDRAGR
jgi:hypothetical protein